MSWCDPSETALIGNAPVVRLLTLIKVVKMSNCVWKKLFDKYSNGEITPEELDVQTRNNQAVLLSAKEPADGWYWIDAKQYGCGGIRVERNKVVEHAPIFKWMKGHTGTEILNKFNHRKVKS